MVNRGTNVSTTVEVTPLSNRFRRKDSNHKFLTGSFESSRTGYTLESATILIVVDVWSEERPVSERSVPRVYQDRCTIIVHVHFGSKSVSPFLPRCMSLLVTHYLCISLLVTHYYTMFSVTIFDVDVRVKTPHTLL